MLSQKQIFPRKAIYAYKQGNTKDYKNYEGYFLKAKLTTTYI